MVDRGKTIICSVLFLDISEYSKKSVSGQISLKERFNAYLSVAIRDVPIDDRIILDTGDGAALSFLGDVGDALQVALSMRESLREGLHMEPPLLVRMGINLGPVRLIRDINGQPNIVGDGINVSQRVMGFADPGQILVSRTYYDAVSRLSPEYAGMFHYQGSRTDKHVREHEIYAIGYPGEFTSTLTLSGEGGRSKGELSQRLGRSWRSIMGAFRRASLPARVAYAGAALAVTIAVALVATSTIWHPPQPTLPQKPEPGQGGVQPFVAASPVTPISAAMASPASAAAAPAVPGTARHPEGAEVKHAPSHKPRPPRRHPKPTPAQPAERAPEARKETEKAPDATGQANLVVVCTEGTKVFVDGQPKGQIGKASMQLKVDPGKHLIMLLSASRVDSRNVEFVAGKTVRLSPRICH